MMAKVLKCSPSHLCSNEFRATVMVDYDSPILGTQHATMYHMGQFVSAHQPMPNVCLPQGGEVFARARAH